MTAHFLSQPGGPKVRVLSRDEDKQEQMMAAHPPGARLSYFLGDVRSLDTLRRAFDGADAVLHAAALKRVGFGERFPDEFTATNVYGSHNVIRAAIDCGVGRTLLVSSDKACSPLNNYGVGKRAAEGLFIQGNSLAAGRGLRFAVVRGGNIWNSRGSVAPKWKAAADAGQPITVNGEHVTRFHLLMGDWLRFNLDALTQMHGGEVFVPKAEAWALGDLARAFGAPVIPCPPRPGDKAAEWLYSGDESYRVVETDWAYVLEPPADFRAIWNYHPWPGRAVALGQPYASDTARRLSAAELRRLVEEL
jgi:UDP-N-acetylglucosamine 4,6-dehydratase